MFYHEAMSYGSKDKRMKIENAFRIDQITASSETLPCGCILEWEARTKSFSVQCDQAPECGKDHVKLFRGLKIMCEAFCELDKPRA